MSTTPIRDYIRDKQLALDNNMRREASEENIIKKVQKDINLCYWLKEKKCLISLQNETNPYYNDALSGLLTREGIPHKKTDKYAIIEL